MENQRIIKILVLTHTREAREESKEYISSLKSVVKKIKSYGDFDLKAVPIDVEGLKHMKKNNTNKIKRFPAAIYMGCTYQGQREVEGLLHGLLQSLDKTKQGYQKEMNRQSAQNSTTDIMNQIAGEDDFDNTFDNGTAQQMMANFNKKRDNVFNQPSKPQGSNDVVSDDLGSFIQPSMFGGNPKDSELFSALLQEETPGC